MSPPAPPWSSSSQLLESENEGKREDEKPHPALNQEQQSYINKMLLFRADSPPTPWVRIISASSFILSKRALSSADPGQEAGHRPPEFLHDTVKQPVLKSGNDIAKLLPHQ